MIAQVPELADGGFWYVVDAEEDGFGSWQQTAITGNRSEYYAPALGLCVVKTHEQFVLPAKVYDAGEVLVAGGDSSGSPGNKTKSRWHA